MWYIPFPTRYPLRKHFFRQIIDSFLYTCRLITIKIGYRNIADVPEDEYGLIDTFDENMLQNINDTVYNYLEKERNFKRYLIVKEFKIT